MTSLTELPKSHRKVAYWLSLGADPRVIAGKTGLTLTYVRSLVKLEQVQKLAEMIRSGEIEELAEITAAQDILKAAAPRAAERIVEVMETAPKEEISLRAAESVLDRTGHARQTEVRHTTILLDAGVAHLIAETERMLKQKEIPEAEYELIETEIENAIHTREPRDHEEGGAESPPGRSDSKSKDT